MDGLIVEIGKTIRKQYGPKGLPPQSTTVTGTDDLLLRGIERLCQWVDDLNARNRELELRLDALEREARSSNKVLNELSPDYGEP